MPQNIGDDSFRRVRCHDDFEFVPMGSGASCKSLKVGLAIHLLCSEGYQIVETVDVDNIIRREANASNSTVDAQKELKLCDMLQATDIIQPSFGHSLRNTWLIQSPPTGNETIDSFR